MLHLPLLIVSDLLSQVDAEEILAGVARFANGRNWPSLGITLLFGSVLVIGGTAGVRKLLGGRIPWLRSKQGGIVVAAFWGFLEATALAVLAGVPSKIAFTLGLNAALTGSGARDWWQKSKEGATSSEVPTQPVPPGADTMTPTPTKPPESTPTEPVNPLPTPPSDLPAPPVPVEPAPTPTGDDGGTTNAQPHCTPEQIADGKCDRG